MKPTMILVCVATIAAIGLTLGGFSPTRAQTPRTTLRRIQVNAQTITALPRLGTAAQANRALILFMKVESQGRKVKAVDTPIAYCF
jgi:hypothetical protein